MPSIFHELPDDIIISIYKYLNPISKPYSISKRYWCFKCGEYIDETSVCIEVPVTNKAMLPLYQKYTTRSPPEIQLFCLDCFNLKNT